MATCAVPWSTRLLLHTTSQTHVELLQREMRAAPRAHRLPAVHAVLSYAVMAEAGLLPVPARRIVLAARLLAKARALPEGDPLRAVADADPAQAQVRDGLAPGRDRGLASRRRGPAVGAVVPGPAAGMRWPTHRLSAYSRTSAPLRRDSTLDETLRVNSSRRSRNGPSGSGRTARQPEEWISCWSPLLHSSYRAEMLALRTATQHLTDHPDPDRLPVIICTPTVGAVPLRQRGQRARRRSRQ